MTGKKGGKPKPRPKVHFKVVQQSYEDKDYEDAPKPVLVPAATLKPKKRRSEVPMFRMGEDMPEDFTEKRNMLMLDDEDDDEDLTRDGKVFFQDEVEEDFGADFIEQMIHGDPADEDTDEDTEALLNDEEAAKYPKHELDGVMDKQFDRMFKEFDRDEDIEEEDPRVQGALDVKTYAPALEEFVEQHAGTTYASELPMKHRGLINQMKQMTREHGLFDTDKEGKGYYVTTLLPDKKSRMQENFHTDVRDLKDLTAEMLKQRREDEKKALAFTKAHGNNPNAGGDASDLVGPDGKKLPPEGKQFVTLRDKRAEHDCETILSTCTTLYNHPNVIRAGGRKKVQLPGTGRVGQIAKEEEKRREKEARQAAKAAKGKHQDPSATAEADDEEAEEEEEDSPFHNGETALQKAAALGIDLSERPKDEGPEEKKLRRQLVKQLQRERRGEKKKLKDAYKNLGTEAAETTKQQKMNKRMTSLSAVNYSK